MIRKIAISLLVTLGLVSTTLFVVPVSSALDIRCQSNNSGQCNLVKAQGDASKTVWNIVSFVLGLLAGIAAIVIIIGGIMFATANGNASQITNARQTILYAVIGLAIAAFSSGIVALVTRFVFK